MGHSKIEYYLHLVWATYPREPLLAGCTEEIVYAFVQSELQWMKCNLLAIGGVEDHLHLVIEPPSMLGPAEIAKHLKGASSRFVNDKDIAFKWQAGYGCFSLSRPHLDAVVPYVKNQKRHHATGRTWRDWEPADD